MGECIWFGWTPKRRAGIVGDKGVTCGEVVVGVVGDPVEDRAYRIRRRRLHDTLQHRLPPGPRLRGKGCETAEEAASCNCAIRTQKCHSLILRKVCCGARHGAAHGMKLLVSLRALQLRILVLATLQGKLSDLQNTSNTRQFGTWQYGEWQQGVREQCSSEGGRLRTWRRTHQQWRERQGGGSRKETEQGEASPAARSLP